MDDPFSLLGLPHTYALSPAHVRRAWLTRAADAHPDRAGGDAGDDVEHARRAALLNDAMRTLIDSERRADALVILLGGPTRSQEKTLRPEFLTEMMDVRSRLEEAHKSGDGDARAELTEWAETQRQEYERRVGAVFASMEEPPSADALREIRLLLNEWRYIERMIEQAEPGP